MTRPRSVYRCADCGHEHPKWVGRCEGCGAWNSVAEEPVASPAARRAPVRKGAARSVAGVPLVALRDIEKSRLIRWTTGIPEFDFVLGGGLVAGSLPYAGIASSQKS